MSDELGKQQAIKITTSKGKLFVVADPLMEDMTMFVNFIKYISGVCLKPFLNVFNNLSQYK